MRLVLGAEFAQSEERKQGTFILFRSMYQGNVCKTGGMEGIFAISARFKSTVEPQCNGSQGTEIFYLLLVDFYYCRFMK